MQAARSSCCEVSGIHRDHVIAFARRRGRHAVITAAVFDAMRRCDRAAYGHGGDAFDGELHIDGYSLPGNCTPDRSKVPLASLFRHLPVAALKAAYIGSVKPAAKRTRQFA